MSTKRRILVPLDFRSAAFTTASLDALEYALELAAELDASIDLLDVATGGLHDEDESDLAEILWALRRRGVTSVRGVSAPEGTPRHAADLLLATALAHQPALVVMGAPDRNHVARLFEPDLAESVARRLPCPSVLVPGRATLRDATTGPIEALAREPVS